MRYCVRESRICRRSCNKTPQVYVDDPKMMKYFLLLHNLTARGPEIFRILRFN